VGDVASAVENVLAAYSDTTVAPHEYFDQTGAQIASLANDAYATGEALLAQRESGPLSAHNSVY
jgi:hypothetical protein